MLKTSLFLLLHFLSTTIWAGSIGFSVEFKGPEVSIVNKGTDAAYNLTLWALNPSLQWQQLVVKQGSNSYIAPESKLQVLRQFALPNNQLGQANPLLIQMQDQAGSNITQLAWQLTPSLTNQPLPIMRNGTQVQLLPFASTNHLEASYAIIASYTRINELTKPLAEPSPPINIKQHIWKNQPELTIDTGQGQGGIWWVHQTITGALEQQMVPDGIVRGTEQTPQWLMWLRNNMSSIAKFLAFLGLVLTISGAVLPNRTTSSDR